MPIEIDDATRKFIRDHRVARLATADGNARPTVIPVCYVFEGDSFYTPIDEKPKRVEPGRLRRLRNIESNPQAALVIDDYSEDWSQLVYVMATGAAEIMTALSGGPEHAHAVELLREKYPQYRQMAIHERPMIKITPTQIKRWAPADGQVARMSFKTLRHKARWWNLVIGSIFLISSVYLDRVGLADANPIWIWVALISPLLTLVFVALTIPKWQSFIGLAVVAYSVFWFYSAWVGKHDGVPINVIEPRPAAYAIQSVSYARTNSESSQPV